MLPMARHLPDDWAVHALCLPGRERRVAQPPDWVPEHVARDAADELRHVLALPELADADIVMTGQCMGAILGYLILAASDRSILDRCGRLVVFSQKPWHRRGVVAPLPADSAAMWEYLVATGDVPAPVAADPEFRDVLEPVFRADHDGVARFPTDVAPLPCPITVVVGDRDNVADRLQPHEWSRYTPALTVVELPSGHLPMHEAPAESAAVLAQPSVPCSASTPLTTAHNESTDSNAAAVSTSSGMSIRNASSS